MLSSFVLALREGVEAALVIGLLFGALRKVNRTDLSNRVWLGAALAGVASLLVAVIFHIIGAQLEGPSEPIFEGSTMLLAAGLITLMIVWLGKQKHGLKGKIEADVGQAVGTSGWALFGVAFLSVLREGIELALFLVAAGYEANSAGSLLGALLGLAGAALLGWVLFRSTHRISLRTFFQATNIVLVLFAAGLVTRAVGEYNEAALIPPVIMHLYNFNPVLNENSLLGQVFQALLGYTGSPSLTQVGAYLVYFAALLLPAILPGMLHRVRASAGRPEQGVTG